MCMGEQRASKRRDVGAVGEFAIQLPEAGTKSARSSPSIRRLNTVGIRSGEYTTLGIAGAPATLSPRRSQIGARRLDKGLEAVIAVS